MPLRIEPPGDTILAMSHPIYVGVIAGFLLISALFHLLLPNLTSLWMTKSLAVRIVGAFLILLSLPALKWQGMYYWTIFVGLAISGLWRLFFPQNSIRAQERSYPRWVHGCLLLAGSIAVWLLRP